VAWRGGDRNAVSQKAIRCSVMHNQYKLHLISIGKCETTGFVDRGAAFFGAGLTVSPQTSDM